MSSHSQVLDKKGEPGAGLYAAGEVAGFGRATRDPWGRVESPMAEWSRQQVTFPLSPAVEQLKRVRTFED